MKHFRVNSIGPPNADGTARPGRRWVTPAAALICLTVALAILSVVTPYPATGASGSAGASTTPAAAAAENVQVLLTAPAEASGGSPLFTLPWGDGPGQVGLVRRADEESRGPEALAVAPDGRVAMLDSVNDRLLLLTPAGDPVATAPLDVAAPRFLAVDSDQVLVLDADDSQRLLTYSWSGERLADVSVGPFDEPVTALLVDSQGQPLIETNHDRVADPAEFSPGRNAQAEARGRPANAGTPGVAVSGRMSPGGRPHVEESDAANGRRRAWDLALQHGGRIDHLVSLDTDTQGRVIVGLRMESERGAGAASDGPADAAASHAGVPDAATAPDAAASLLLARLGEPIQTLILREAAGAYLGAPYVLAPSGLIYQPIAADEGYSIVTHAFPAVQAEVER
ncbi:MAG: hypothetical protein ACYC33_02680 [Thermoleophilia bacterium]